MQRHFRKSLWLSVTSLVIVSLGVGVALAHEGRPVGDYRFIVGWLGEPAYEGARNAVSVQINKVVEGVEEGADGHSGVSTSSTAEDKEEDSAGHHGAEDQEEENTDHHGEAPGATPAMTHEEKEYGEDSSHHGAEDKIGDHSSRMVSAPKVLASVAGQHEGQAVPVEGLEGSIQVEVTHVGSGTQRTLELLAVYGEPGHYMAPMIPTATGVYEFRVFGAIEGAAIDETFASTGGGGGFDDIRSSAGLHFPEELPEIREIESGVRGALQTAQEAQDAALAAQQDGGGGTLAIVALIVGIVGVVFGVGGVFFAMRARKT